MVVEDKPQFDFNWDESFTLIEVLVVLVVLAILIAILIILINPLEL